VDGAAFGNLQYAKWVADRRDIVTKLGNGEIGYLHIRRWMRRRCGSSSSISRRTARRRRWSSISAFNGGGGIDQELLGILAGRQYQYTVNRDAGMQMARPAELLRPDGRDAERALGVGRGDVPAGFKALGLGKVVGGRRWAR